MLLFLDVSSTKMNFQLFSGGKMYQNQTADLKKMATRVFEQRA
jgi:hypothetical protein